MQQTGARPPTKHGLTRPEMQDNAGAAPLDQASRRKLLGLMIAGTIAAMLALVVTAEITVRIRQHFKYGSAAALEDYFTVDPSSGLRIPIAGKTDARISVNSLGFRGPEINPSKPANAVRLAFLGASTTWCAEVSGNEAVWAHQVAARLGKTFPDKPIDYVNAGVPGYTTASVLRALQTRVAQLKPDVIVIYEASNDLTGEMRHLAAERGLIVSERFQDLHWPSRYSLLWTLVEKNLRLLLAKRASREPHLRLDVDPTHIGVSYRKSLLAVVREAQRHARLVAVATFAIQPRREHSAERKLLGSSSAMYYMPYVQPDTIIEAFARYNQIARQVARETGALLIEGEHDIPGDALHFHDTVHFTDAGSAAMASRVADALESSAEFRAIARP